MWIEIVSPEGKTIGAVNSECCDLIRVGEEGPAGRAFIHLTTDDSVLLTKVSYLRLIETITSSEASALAHIASVVAETKDREQPRLVLP